MATGSKTGGRKKGVPNKINKALKDMILAALDEVGGVDYLTAQAQENPVAFLSLIAKVLPMQTDLNVTGTLFSKIERVIIDPQ